MEEEVLVSVVIPLYNAEFYIRDTIESVKNQTYKNIEIIIVDNCSTDNSYVIVSDLCNENKKIKLLKTSCNSGGPAHPRNVGIEASKGNYIAFLDSDDIWEESKLELQVGFMLKEGFNFLSTSTCNIDGLGHLLNVNSKKKRGDNVIYNVKSMLIRNTITTSSVLIERTFLGDLRFCEDDDLVTVEDYFLWLQLLNKKSCNFCKLDYALVKYRVFPESLGSRGGKSRFLIKSLLASSKFLLLSNGKYLAIVLTSHFLRLFRLLLRREI